MPGQQRVDEKSNEITAIARLSDLSLVKQGADWPGLQTLVRIEAERYHKASGKTEREIRYYISILWPEAARLNRPYVNTGALKTSCTGCSTWPFVETPAGNEMEVRLRTSPVSPVLLSICSSRTKLPNSA